jgi:glycosyltransferase involved in cell wall biosynthesis
MWNGQTVAVVLPTYRERASIAACIRDFEALGIVDDIIVVNNNAEAGTSEEVATTSAREVHESRQGYGAAIQRGLAESTADLVCICEPDATFEPADLLKLLAYIGECTVVFGYRTVTTFIWSGANMSYFLRWGNWAVAKLIEVLFNTPYLSDVGCTMRLLRREAITTITPGFRSAGSRFGLEMQMLVVVAEQPFVQIPVNYRPRVGTSAVTGDLSKTLALGFDMIGLVLRMRIGQRRIRAGLR